MRRVPDKQPSARRLAAYTLALLAALALGIGSAVSAVADEGGAPQGQPDEQVHEQGPPPGPACLPSIRAALVATSDDGRRRRIRSRLSCAGSGEYELRLRSKAQTRTLTISAARPERSAWLRAGVRERYVVVRLMVQGSADGSWCTRHVHIARTAPAITASAQSPLARAASEPAC